MTGAPGTPDGAPAEPADAADSADAAAAILAAHRTAGTRLDRLPAALVPADPAAAYAVQARLRERLAPELGARAGDKVGCTTPVMQAYLGIPTPCAGTIYAATILRSPARRAVPADVVLGVECEIAVRLAADLPGGPEGVGREAAAAAVGRVMLALEIVADRYRDYSALDTPTLIADDFFGAGCVLGPELPAAGIDLRAVTAAMTIDGEERGRGVGTEILGDPLAVLAWLADLRAAAGTPLRAGMIVLLGSLVRTQWVAAGQAIVGASPQLGRVELTMGAAAGG